MAIQTAERTTGPRRAAWVLILAHSAQSVVVLGLATALVVAP